MRIALVGAPETADELRALAPDLTIHASADPAEVVPGARAVIVAPGSEKAVAQCEAPQALFINILNPAGGATGALTVGVSDAPAVLADRVIKLLHLDPERAVFNWSGVRHCGWLTGIHEETRPLRPDFLHAGLPDPMALPPEDRLPDLFRDPERLARVYPDRSLDPAELAGALPLDPAAPAGWARTALTVIRGITQAPVRAVVHTRNRTALGGPAVPELPADAVVVCPAVIGSDNARPVIQPLPQPPLPPAKGRLLREAHAAPRPA